jgi:hypothetical protein
VSKPASDCDDPLFVQLSNIELGEAAGYARGICAWAAAIAIALATAASKSVFIGVLVSFVRQVAAGEVDYSSLADQVWSPDLTAS